MQKNRVASVSLLIRSATLGFTHRKVKSLMIHGPVTRLRSPAPRAAPLDIGPALAPLGCGNVTRHASQ